MTDSRLTPAVPIRSSQSDPLDVLFHLTRFARWDRTLHVVIQEQTTAKRTIGFTASYLTATPCTEEIAGKKTDVELKGTLGTYTDAKGAGLATDLAGMLDQDLQPLRSASTAPSTR